jgi:integrase
MNKPPTSTDNLGFSRDEADRYEAAARDFPHGDLCLLLLRCCLRGSEGRNLLRGDLRLEADPPCLRVNTRLLALDPDTARLLRDRLAWRDRAREQATRWDDPVDHVFTTAYGTPIGEGQLRRIHNRICMRAGLRPISVHGLRYTTASLLMAAGVPHSEVARILGHTTWRGR